MQRDVRPGGRLGRGSRLYRAFCPECGEPMGVTLLQWRIHDELGTLLEPCMNCNDNYRHKIAYPRRTKIIQDDGSGEDDGLLSEDG